MIRSFVGIWIILVILGEIFGFDGDAVTLAFIGWGVHNFWDAIADIIKVILLILSLITLAITYTILGFLAYFTALGTVNLCYLLHNQPWICGCQISKPQPFLTKPNSIIYLPVFQSDSQLTYHTHHQLTFAI